jgi:hypothetical protein
MNSILPSPLQAGRRLRGERLEVGSLRIEGGEAVMDGIAGRVRGTTVDMGEKPPSPEVLLEVDAVIAGTTRPAQRDPIRRMDSAWGSAISRRSSLPPV